ncbi:hypothetical protein GQ43DRAFT_88889 [Delitschia confertaspora ATCC 74209]|uniref:Homeobox domain-containing protein n=1 Tax=Delitschia confertaspora ATCC 74209 TaxID=1513339 RepID=A0A9P4MXQ2_9PLEO|nr:hypothetical protein GQ43DRAFT_88889 [Delitschia confertaspora ATCC 74209]
MPKGNNTVEKKLHVKASFDSGYETFPIFSDDEVEEQERGLAEMDISRLSITTTFRTPSCTSTPSTSPLSAVLLESNVKRSRAGRNSKLPIKALNTLQAWLDAHQDNPYPTAGEKRQLAEECGITEKQVTTWFTNARARKLNWVSSSSDEEAGQETDEGDRSLDITSNNGYPTFGEYSHSGRGRSVSGSSAYTPITQAGSSRQTPSRRGKKKNYRRNQTGQIGDSSIPQDGLATSPIHSNNSASFQDTWQCTFCLRHLVPKSWRRHEETQHRPRAQWTCMLTGPRLSYSHRTGSCCAFCMEKEPSEDHFLSCHRISECAKRPVQERTFYRPDHLRQHIKNFHGSTLFDITQSRWKKAAETENNGWACGFCGEGLSTWDQREKHIANHFKEGMTMSQWNIHGGYDTRQQPHHQHNSSLNSSESVASVATAQPPVAPSTNPFNFPMVGGTAMPTTPSYSTSYYPPVSTSAFPTINTTLDPLANICGNPGFFEWTQITQPMVQQYPTISDNFDRNYLALQSEDFESALNSVWDFGDARERGQPWSGP